MTPTESLANYIADTRYDIAAWNSYFAPDNWIRNGLPDIEQSRPQLTIDDGVFTTLERNKNAYSEVTFATVSLWFSKNLNSKKQIEQANEISAQIMLNLHEHITVENIRIECQGRTTTTDIESGKGRVRMSFRLMEMA